MREITCIQLLIEYGPAEFDGAMVWLHPMGKEGSTDRIGGVFS